MNHCDTPSHKHGKDRNGFQRYKCPICGKTFGDNSGKPGRKLLGDRKLTNKERKQRQREKAKYGKATFVPIELG